MPRALEHIRGKAGRQDIWILIGLAVLVVSGVIFVSFRIVDQSERHVQAVKDMKVSESIDNAWAPQSSEVDSMVRQDLESNPDRQEAKYSNIQITETSLKYISRMRKLKSLSLSGCSVKDDWLIHIEHLPLEAVALSDCDITDNGMLHLAKIKTLRSLHVNGCHRIGDRGVEIISGLPLDDLHLSRTSITNAGVKSLTACKSLEKLNLSGTSISSAAYPELSRMPSLLALDLSEVAVTPKDLESLKKAPKLWSLNLEDCGLHDDALKALADFPVQKLVVSKNPFTSRGIDYLCSNHKVAALKIDKCPYVTDSDLQRLKKAKPNCRFLTSDQKREQLKDAIWDFL
jgi:hypothetical protein